MAQVDKEGESPEKVETPESEEEAATPQPLSRQLPALLMLVLVLGVLWLLMHYLPTAGNWLGNATKEIVSSKDRTEESPKESPPEKKIVNQPKKSGAEDTETKQAVVAQPDRNQFYIGQIEEQLGGAGKVEVRHLALSEDESKMVAALRLIEENGESQLLELYFERDDFGRYLSTKDSPLDVPVTVWPE